MNCADGRMAVEGLAANAAAGFPVGRALRSWSGRDHWVANVVAVCLAMVVVAAGTIPGVPYVAAGGIPPGVGLLKGIEYDVGDVTGIRPATGRE